MPPPDASSGATAILQPRITRDAAGRARCVDLPARLLGRRPGSTRTHPPCPTSTRTCSARGASPARASTTSTPSSQAMDGRRARERAAEPRPLRRRLRPGGARDRPRAVRRVPLELPGRGLAPASLGARRLAAPAVDPRPRARRDAATDADRIPGIARWKMVDNLRRTLSALLTVATLVVAWTRARPVGGDVDGVRAGRDRHPAGAARPRRASAAAPGHLEAKPSAGGRRRRRASRPRTSDSPGRSSPTRRG